MNATIPSAKAPLPRKKPSAKSRPIDRHRLAKRCDYSRTVPIRDAEPVANFIQRKESEVGLDVDSLLLAAEHAFPGISLLTFCGGLMLYRARSNDPGYDFVFPTGGMLQ